jgi:hypothetical protein
MVLDKDNPFLPDVIEMFKGKGGKSVTEMSGDGQLTRQRVTVVFEREYIKMPFTKLYQHKEMLEDLDPWACKIMMYIGLNLGYQEQKIRLTPELVKMDKRKFYKTVFELIARRILRKEKPKWYWVNVTLMVVGNMEQPQAGE